MHSQSIRIFFIINVLLLAATACQGPEPASTRPSSEQTIIVLIQTITAQASGVSNAAQSIGLPATANALQSDAVVTETPSAPTALPQPTIEASAIPYIPPTITASPAIPLVSVSSETNCRTGPSRYYKFIWKAEAGTTFEVVGKHFSTGYWIIKLPDGRECWLWGEYATVEGNVNNLPEYIPPAVGRIEGELRKSSASDAGKIDNAFVNIGLGNFDVYQTRSDGKFIFEDVPIGQVTIKVSHNYYLISTFDVFVSAGQVTSVIKFALVPYNYPLPPSATPTRPCIFVPRCQILLPTFAPAFPFP